VVVDREGAENDVVRLQPELFPYLAQRADVRRLTVVQRPARGAPGTAVVRPLRAVLQQHLRPVHPVAVQEQARRARPTPVPVAQRARGPAVGGGEGHDASEHVC